MPLTPQYEVDIRTGFSGPFNATFAKSTGTDPLGRDWWEMTATGTGILFHFSNKLSGLDLSVEGALWVCAIVKAGTANIAMINTANGPAPAGQLTGAGSILAGTGGIRYEGNFGGDEVYTLYFEKVAGYAGGDNIYWQTTNASGLELYEQAGESFHIGTFWLEDKVGSEPSALDVGGNTYGEFLGFSARALDAVAGLGGVSVGPLENDVWFPLIASQVTAADVATVANDGPFVQIIGTGNVIVTFTAYRADLSIATNEALDLIGGQLVELSGDIALVTGPTPTTDENGQVIVEVEPLQVGNATVKISVGGIIGIASVQVAAVPAPGIGVRSAWSKPLVRT